MNRAEFTERLRELLSDISESEREEALNYYEDYFNDAGAENEQSVIGELGSPEKVARTIKEGLNDGSGERGEFSEQGFRGYGEEPKEEVGTRRKQSVFDRIRNLGMGGMILVAVLAIFAIPVLLPICLGGIGVVLSVIFAVIGILFAVLLAGAGLVFSGALLFGGAVFTVAVSPTVSAILIGISFALVGVGILLTILGGWIVWKAVPPVIRWIVKICRKPFEGKEEQSS